MMNYSRLLAGALSAAVLAASLCGCGKVETPLPLATTAATTTAATTTAAATTAATTTAAATTAAATTAAATTAAATTAATTTAAATTAAATTAAATTAAATTAAATTAATTTAAATTAAATTAAATTAAATTAAATTAAATTAVSVPSKTGENALAHLTAGFTNERVTDPHTPLTRDSNLTGLEALYAGLAVQSGDMHHHTWYSDGYNTFAEVKASADKYKYDFFACSDHNNWKQTNDVLWAQDRNLYSMEYTTSKGHMNIYFPTQEALQKVQEFTYHDPDRNRDYVMKFDIPDEPVISPRYWGQGLMQTFTKTLQTGSDFYRQLVEYVHSMGGFIYLCHPYGGGNNFTPLADENDNIEYFGFDGVEVFNATRLNHPGLISANVRTYEYWQYLLNEGHKVYASAGSDTHYLFDGDTITHLNTAEKNAAAYFAAIDSGNYSISHRIDGLRIRMSLGDTMMGGTAPYVPGQTLCVRIDVVKSYGPYRVNIYTDRGIAFSQIYSTGNVEIEIPVENRLYYRVEIVKNGVSVISTTNNKSYPFYLAISQPIFLSAVG